MERKGLDFREILGRCDRRLWTSEMSEDDLVKLAKLYLKSDVHKVRIGAGCIYIWEKVFWSAVRKEGFCLFCFSFYV